MAESFTPRTAVTDSAFGRYLKRINDAETPAQLVDIQKDLWREPDSHERDTLQRTIRRMMISRAAQS